MWQDTIRLLIEWYTSHWMMIQTIILAVTACLVFVYARAASEQTKALTQANTFNATTRVNERFTDPFHYRLRTYLHTEFMNDLVSATEKTLDRKYIASEANNETIDVAKVIAELEEDQDKLHDFNKTLRDKPAGFPGYTGILDASTLDAVEVVLMDFDLIALPFSLGYEAGKILAEAYKPVLSAIAPKILPFVAIQRKLRGSKDPTYKGFYLYLLSELHIPLMGISAPETPWPKNYRLT